MPPVTTVPGLPTSVSSRVITSGPFTTPAGSVTVGGRVAYATLLAASRITAAAATAGAPRRPSSPPSSAYESRSHGKAACPSTWASSHVAAKSARAGPSGAMMPTGPASETTSTSSSAPRGSATQPGW